MSKHAQPQQAVRVFFFSFLGACSTVDATVAPAPVDSGFAEVQLIF